MALKIYDEADIQAIANAIREKTESTDTFLVSQMAQAIADISTGGKVAFGVAKPTTSSYFTIPHHLGETPNWFVVISTAFSTSYTNGCGYNKDYASTVSVSRTSSTTKSFSTTKGSTSYAYADSEECTIPYYSSSYYWNTSADYIWACGV